MDVDMIKACQEEARKLQQGVSEMKILLEDREIPKTELEARKKHLELLMQQHCQQIVERAREEGLRLKKEAEKLKGKCNAISGKKED
ncbi:hypothetical protein RchiOBHm_Chr5g0065121 [Rosa chinensis]|uniref:Uncharacterized protein n=1 Tax=Rosa chinensis TaxID=74649 RepID=A0A2P6QIU4_ROSCH|nr:hypothetical protein RchiOBHm_Chr5g0065121 [Rosa chinensis]